MGYIDRNLMEGESVVYRTRLHWVIFLWPALFFAFAILSLGIVRDGAAGGFALFILIAMFLSIPSFLNYTTSEFGITNRRVVVKVGFIRRSSLEVLLNKIEGIQVDQGIMGRILGYGTITVSGTGGTKDPFHRIKAPLEFRRRAQEQISSIQDAK